MWRRQQPYWHAVFAIVWTAAFVVTLVDDPGGDGALHHQWGLVVTASDISRRRLVKLPWDYADYGLDPDEQLVADAVHAGASGFLLKDVRPDDLVHAVRAVHAGETLLAPAITRRLLQRFTRGRSSEAAARLGCSMTTFNRKLDNVCEKLDKIGVDGLRGGRGKLATNRRARLVEYAVATRLVSTDDLALLDGTDGTGDGGEPPA